MKRKITTEDALRMMQKVGSGGQTEVAWDDITGKPSTFPPEAHTHDYATADVDQTGSRTMKIVIGDMAIVAGAVSITTGTDLEEDCYTGGADVSFGVTFKYAPVMAVTFSGRYYNMKVVGTSYVNTTGATVWAKTSEAEVTRAVQWIAIGQLA